MCHHHRSARPAPTGASTPTHSRCSLHRTPSLGCRPRCRPASMSLRLSTKSQFAGPDAHAAASSAEPRRHLYRLQPLAPFSARRFCGATHDLRTLGQKSAERKATGRGDDKQRMVVDVHDVLAASESAIASAIWVQLTPCIRMRPDAALALNRSRSPCGCPIRSSKRPSHFAGPSRFSGPRPRPHPRRLA